MGASSLREPSTTPWAWWLENRSDPFEGGRPTDWGIQHTPTVNAAVRFAQRDGKWQWEQYLALHRSGALELGLGRKGSRPLERGEDVRPRHGFFLSTIVGHIWVAVTLYLDVIARYGLQGPWEVSLALKETEGSSLGNVAPGWLDFGGWGGADEEPLCPEPNLLIRRELES